MGVELESKTSLAKIIYHPQEGFVEGIYNAVYIDNIEELEQLYKSVLHLTRNKKIPCLINIQHTKGISKKCRQYIAERNKKTFNAVAILVGNPLSKIAGNLLITFTKFSHPIRLFTSRENAIDWLEAYTK